MYTLHLQFNSSKGKKHKGNHENIKEQVLKGYHQFFINSSKKIQEEETCLNSFYKASITYIISR
jgi:hypothetical protein